MSRAAALIIFERCLPCRRARYGLRPSGFGRAGSRRGPILPSGGGITIPAVGIHQHRAPHSHVADPGQDGPPGDRLLAAVGRVLRASVRPGDLVIRWGGDEFLVLCRGVEEAETVFVARRLRRALE